VACFHEVQRFLHDLAVAGHADEIDAQQARLALQAVGLGIEKNRLEELGNAAERLIPGVGQPVVARLAAVEFHDRRIH
jgi:hypothetical protein